MSAAPKHHLRLAVILGIAGAIATACVLPYVFALMPGTLARLRSAPLPLPLLLAFQLAQSAVLLTALSWAGLKLGAPLGLDAPLLRALAYRRDRPVPPARDIAVAIAIGVATAAAIVALDAFFKPLLPAPLRPLPAGGARWQGFLASFYGGIGEEIQLRLFLMTLLAWIGWRLFARRRVPVPRAVYVAAIAISALAFAAGHLPLAIEIWGFGAANVARTLVLNVIAGIAFGWLFWRRGLEQAMLAHFSADIVLHVVVGA
jgi:hypothetical protein